MEIHLFSYVECIRYRYFNFYRRLHNSTDTLWQGVRTFSVYTCAVALSCTLSNSRAGRKKPVENKMRSIHVGSCMTVGVSWLVVIPGRADEWCEAVEVDATFWGAAQWRGVDSAESGVTTLCRRRPPSEQRRNVDRLISSLHSVWTPTRLMRRQLSPRPFSDLEPDVLSTHVSSILVSVFVFFFFYC